MQWMKAWMGNRFLRYTEFIADTTAGRNAWKTCTVQINVNSDYSLMSSLLISCNACYPFVSWLGSICSNLRKESRKTQRKTVGSVCRWGAGGGGWDEHSSSLKDSSVICASGLAATSIAVYMTECNRGRTFTRHFHALAVLVVYSNRIVKHFTMFLFRCYTL
jgi:hypothetical protein